MMAEICDICLQVISEGDIEEHKQQCEVWVCSDCGMSLAFKDKDTHLEDHKISSVTCSRCGDKMESSDALKHEESCLFRSIPCQFCEEEFAFVNLPTHETLCAAKRLCLETKVEVDNVNNEVAKMKSEREMEAERLQLEEEMKQADKMEIKTMQSELTNGLSPSKLRNGIPVSSHNRINSPGNSQIRPGSNAPITIMVANGEPCAICKVLVAPEFKQEHEQLCKKLLNSDSSKTFSNVAPLPALTTTGGTTTPPRLMDDSKKCRPSPPANKKRGNDKQKPLLRGSGLTSKRR
eukprot:m.218017 g.218017  ORF g.218017 m.218017 type:complete len:292 (-) comp15898_c0_seq4:5660-6535(-)